MLQFVPSHAARLTAAAVGYGKDRLASFTEEREGGGRIPRFKGASLLPLPHAWPLACRVQSHNAQAARPSGVGLLQRGCSYPRLRPIDRPESVARMIVPAAAARSSLIIL